MKNLKQLKLKIDSLAVFGSLKDDPVVAGLCSLIDNLDVESYSAFVSGLYPYGSNLSEYVKTLVLEDDNFYVKKVAAGEKIDSEIVDAVKRELAVLDEVASVTPEDINDQMAELSFSLPSWKTAPTKLMKNFTAKLSEISRTGYGIFARYNFFRVVDGRLAPVAHPDFQPLDRLFEYKRERELIIKNTEALISGESANNVLLYGDMGTGKSSTIKAVAAAYAHMGLRIIEVKKNQLYQVPDIMEELASNPLKFILFIDDLSFAGNDDNFAALKAALEGSISGRGTNTAIYATSNRRHLVRESAADRIGGVGMDEDMHINDTLQETMSLSARFGLTITFSKPGKDQYLSIVLSLAREAGIEIGDDSPDAMPKEVLFQKAEAFAIRRNGRSPRTAHQFIELLKIGI